MFVTETRLRAKIDSFDQMEIRASKGDILVTTTGHKLLGVYIDSDLSFNEHVEHLCKKLVKAYSLCSYTAKQSGVITSKENIRRVF